jgi:hypothetical protein
MNDELTLLASAYLDGEVDAAERARVEGDPELLAEVDRLRAVRALIGDTEPSPISIREELLANALDAWDRLPAAERNRDATPRALDRSVHPGAAAAASTITAPTSLADRRRATLNRRLLGAAAAIVLVLGAGIVAQVVTSDSSDDSDTVADVAASPAAEGGDAASDTESNAESSPASDEDRSVAGGELAPEADLAADATESTQLDTGVNDAAPPGERELEQLSTPDELAIFASDAVGAPVAPEVPAATSAPVDDLLSDTEAAILDAELPLCLGADYVVGPALYGDVEVVVAVDESRDLALAYTPVECREIARARLP